MSIFGSDPKDEMIALLKDQLAQKDARIADLEKREMAYLDPRAFALNHPRATVVMPKQENLPPSPMDLRDVPFKPRLSRAEIEKQFTLKSA